MHPDAASASLLPDLPRIVAFRNTLIHGYANVDNHIVWGVLETHVPPLIATLTRMLAQHGKP